ncbi:UNVERIFIED_CONTAM: Organic cation/carnitine transporter 3 [Sesamum latifolium]|uniref:Organic cation/carnitine transporter 3 n=1 Tax=Sesamum latifolium TaxID=2727402 RepID=A0AAW2U308_9LAMI
MGLSYGIKSAIIPNPKIPLPPNILSQLPATLATIFLRGKLRRKDTVAGLALLSGICCPASMFVRWKGLQIALEIVSFFSTHATFDFLSIYTLELFPTCFRNSAVSLVRQGRCSPEFSAQR